jgi:hypothetical protein
MKASRQATSDYVWKAADSMILGQIVAGYVLGISLIIGFFVCLAIAEYYIGIACGVAGLVWMSQAILALHVRSATNTLWARLARLEDRIQGPPTSD